MGKFIKRKKLTETQYRRANRVMCLIVVVSYLVYIVVELMNGKTTGMSGSVLARCVVYGMAGLASVAATIALSKKKSCMLVMAVSYLIAFWVLVMGNGVVVLTMVLPALIGFMVYLNTMLVGLGWIGAWMVGILKCVQVSHDPVLFNYGILILAGYAVATVGSMTVIILLTNFSKEDRAVIEQEAEHRAKVAETVSNIVQTLDTDFTLMVRGLDTINDAMRSADEAMNSIAASTESTAQAVTEQVAMTGQIQRNLEHTDQTASEARQTTEELKTIVTNGKTQADSLLKQSDLVDQDVDGISQLMNQLVENVQKVSGITNTILNISTQTNLLALNASVESARAGEAGKGFSVIANQIRILAQETETSTEEIENIIKELNTITKATQKAIRNSAENINTQREQVHEVNGNLTAIQTGIVELQVAIETMGGEVDSVLQTNQEIVDSIESLSAASEELSVGTQICKNTTGTAFENLGIFSKKVDGAFVQLKHLKETAVESQPL